MAGEIVIGGVIAMASSVIGAWVGAAISHKSSKIVQEREWKKGMSFDIYHPLLDELSQIKEHVWRYDYEKMLGSKKIGSNPVKLRKKPEEWNRILDGHLHRRIPKPLRDELFKFYDFDLHNFVVSSDAATRVVSNNCREELLKMINSSDNKIRDVASGKEYSIDGFMPSFQFINQSGRAALCQEAGGGSALDLIAYLMIRDNWDKLKGYLTPGFESCDQFIKFLSKQVENEDIVKDVREKRKTIYSGIDALIKRVENESEVS